VLPAAALPAAVLLAASIAAGPPGCARRRDGPPYALQGQVVAVAPTRLEATIAHEDVRGLMPAMTMPYKVRDARLLEGIAPGDLIKATLVIELDGAYLSSVKKVGRAPVQSQPDRDRHSAPEVSARVDLLESGDPVPDADLVDQDGRPLRLSRFRGQVVLLTFTYTRCPLPMFCPLIDRQFAAIQKVLRGDSRMDGRVHLVSVTFDPTRDTPSVLKDHARTLGADPRTWTFLTGDGPEIDRFAARFGIAVTRAPGDPTDITHNLRTALIDAGGKLVKVYTGNAWTPEQVLAEITSAASPGGSGGPGESGGPGGRGRSGDPSS
jgi:protein SCO1